MSEANYSYNVKNKMVRRIDIRFLGYVERELYLRLRGWCVERNIDPMGGLYAFDYCECSEREKKLLDDIMAKDGVNYSLFFRCDPDLDDGTYEFVINRAE